MKNGSIKVTEKCPLCGGKTVKIAYHTEAGIVILSEYNCKVCGTYVRMNFLVADEKQFIYNIINQIPQSVIRVPNISRSEIFSFKKITDSGVAINGEVAVIAAVVDAAENDRAPY